jgi:alpha-L-arabinofuranosidase
MMSERRDGTALRVAQGGPCYASAWHGDVPGRGLVRDPRGDLLRVFAVNRSVGAVVPLRVERGDRPLAAVASAELLTGPDAKAANSFEAQDVVTTRPLDGVRIRDGVATCELRRTRSRRCRCGLEVVETPFTGDRLRGCA